MLKYLGKEPDYDLPKLNQEMISHFGKAQRVDKAIEELIELAYVLGRIRKLPQTCINSRDEFFNEYVADFLEEAADVLVMLECLFDTFEIDKSMIDVSFFEKIEKMKGVLKQQQVMR